MLVQAKVSYNFRILYQPLAILLPILFFVIGINYSNTTPISLDTYNKAFI